MAAPTVVDPRKRDPQDGPSGRYHIVVLGRDGAVPYPLPATGEVLIGRDENADVRVLDPKASRNHARVCVGERVEIEDLGSANGTRVRDESLQAGTRVRLQPGDSVTIGNTILVLHAGDPEIGTRRVWTHGYLETRLIEECAGAQSRGSQFALIRIHVEGSPSVPLVERCLADVLRGGDLLGAYGPGEYQALLLDSGEDGARAVAETIDGALGREGIASRRGVACYPADGTSPQALVSCASERVRASSGADAVLGLGAEGTGMVVGGGPMQELYELARRAAASNSNVLVLGETGAGKEVFAEMLHRLSPRAKQPFLPLNCAALSESLVESELFGFERGAFTGAIQAKKGLMEAASGGTLFLDEIGEMPLSTQAKLLRVIETKQVLRVGAVRPQSIDVRFIAATHRDLEEEVAEKRFREDLYFRLNVISLHIPPLRERLQEIRPLAQLFLERLARPAGRPIPSLSDAAASLLQGYAWPGNVRELRNVMERALVLCVGSVITPEHLPADKMRRNSWPPLEPQSGAAEAGPASDAQLPPWHPTLKQVERQAMMDALGRCHGNQTRAAELLGMPRRTFCKRMKEYEIPRPRV